MAKMPKSPKKKGEFPLPDAAEFAAMFEDDPDALDLTDGEKVATQISLLPMPVMNMVAENEQLVAFLVALNPDLTIGEADQGLDHLEEMLIMLLADVRMERRELKSGPGSANPQARASTIHGAEAIDFLEDFVSGELPVMLPGFSPEDMKRNLKTLKNRQG